jgi:acyl carrier protein
MKATIAAEVRNFIVHTFLLGDDSRLKDETSFIEEGLIDSTGILELVGFLEERYEFRVEDNELVPENLDSVDRVASYICSKLQIPASSAALSQPALA